ncbi:hypothetical protein DB32_000335 [Sandaracinus amylolyticus]|uniref:Uncharacterized protein n=1 Tax=Sandaracinus amylolyticus TaxID=927083 RepID=A0A0F6VYY3_9BACT|nr:hypothetical protein DB32_000335 [Sandaracinus amylolyticus]
MGRKPPPRFEYAARARRRDAVRHRDCSGPGADARRGTTLGRPEQRGKPS